jgi:hypothetical protein
VLGGLAVLVIGVLVGVIVAMAMNNDGGNDNAVAVKSTAPTTVSVATTVTSAPATVTTLASRPAQNPIPITAQPSTNNAPPTNPAVTTTTLPKPVFTQAAASPSAVHCSGGEFPPPVPVTISYTATNSASVKSSLGAAGKDPAGTIQGTFYINDACAPNHPTQITLTATGPGGSTTTTVSWSYV